MPTESLTISTTTNRVSGWTYDVAGNVTNDGTHTYAYDAENRLISVDAGVTATYAYGPNGERVWKVAGGVTTYYYWGIGEKVSGSWTKFFVSGLGGKLVEYSSSTTKFFVTNHLGSVAARMDVSGTLSETYRYLPFGERYAGTHTTHQFTGKERDAESGLDYFGARYLASTHGRWMSVDPEMGDPQNPQRLNRYAYVLNDPIKYVDADGRTECFPLPDGTVVCDDLGRITVFGSLSGILGGVANSSVAPLRPRRPPEALKENSTSGLLTWLTMDRVSTTFDSPFMGPCLISEIYDPTGSTIGRNHPAVDISANDAFDNIIGGGPLRGFGTPVGAIGGGSVTEIGTQPGTNVNYIKIYDKANDIELSYTHVTASQGLHIGQQVHTGQHLGVIDDSGGVDLAHLHLVFRFGDNPSPGPGFPSVGDKFDPEPYLPCERKPGLSSP